MKYKAIMTDLDGTAVDSPKQKLATKRLADSIMRLEELGVKICAATGRAPSFAMPVIKSMGLNGPAIVSGGTKILDSVTGEELWSCDLSKKQVKQIKERVGSLQYGFLWNDSTEEDYLSGGWNIDLLNENESIYFFEICFVPAGHLKDVLKVLEGIDGVAVTVVVAQKPGTHDLHITNVHATKEHAIYEVEKILGISKTEMIGIGDGHNDLHIYNAVGYKVAMDNAVPELKSAADIIIGNVVGDGLARYFEELAKEIEDEI